MSVFLMDVSKHWKPYREGIVKCINMKWELAGQKTIQVKEFVNSLQD